jgi:hypothetical protein
MNATTGKQQSGRIARRIKEPARTETGSPRTARIGGVVIGVLAGQAEDGEWLVAHPSAAAGSQRARPVTGESLEPGMAVALMFEGGDPEKPLIMGPVVSPPAARDGAPAVVELEAKRRIVLRCGHSSLTLTEAGKVILRGKYLLSRSSGVNRIKGASVQIN